MRNSYNDVYIRSHVDVYTACYAVSDVLTLYTVGTSGLESRDMLMVKWQVDLLECIAYWSSHRHPWSDIVHVYPNVTRNDWITSSLHTTYTYHKEASAVSY